MFGWNPIDFAEESSLRDTFDEIDQGKTGHVEKDEMRQLFTSLELELSEDQFERLFDEMDSHGTGVIHYEEFRVRRQCVS
jgi:Ca2+-binding EF-hand superfamily protein